MSNRLTRPSSLSLQVKREKYNAFSARYEAELRNRRLLFQSRERLGDMKRPWTASSSPLSSPQLSPTKRETKSSQSATRNVAKRAPDPEDAKTKETGPSVVVPTGKGKQSVEKALEITSVSRKEKTAAQPPPPQSAPPERSAKEVREKRKSAIAAMRKAGKRASVISAAQKKAEE